MYKQLENNDVLKYYNDKTYEIFKYIFSYALMRT